jgi:hypothetical protein
VGRTRFTLQTGRQRSRQHVRDLGGLERRDDPRQERRL